MDELSEYRQRIGLFNISVASKSNKTVKRRKTENVRKPCKSVMKRGSVNRRRKQPRRQNVQNRKMEYSSKSENFSPTLSESKTEHSQNTQLFLNLLIIVSALLILDKNIVKLDGTDISQMHTKIFRDAILIKTEPMKGHLVADVRRQRFQTKSGLTWLYAESALFDLKHSGFASMQEASENLKTIQKTSYHCMNLNNSTREYSCFQAKSMNNISRRIGDICRTCEHRLHLGTSNILLFGFDSDTPRFKTKYLSHYRDEALVCYSLEKEYKDVYHHHMINSAEYLRSAPRLTLKQERGCNENDWITVQFSPLSSGVFSTRDYGCGFPIELENTKLFHSEKIKENHGLLLNRHNFSFSVKKSYECDTWLPSFCRQKVFKCFWCMDTEWTYFMHQIHHYVQFFCDFKPENIQLWLFIKPILDILYCCGIFLKGKHQKINSPMVQFQGYKSRTCNAPIPINFLGFRKQGICCACDCSCLGSCYYLLGNAGCHMYNGNPEDSMKTRQLQRKMAYELSNMIAPCFPKKWSDFMNMVDLNQVEKRQCENFYDILDKLSEKALISIGNYDYLKEIFTTIEQLECCNIVTKYSKLIEKERAESQNEQSGSSGLENERGSKITDLMECQLELWKENEKYFVETKATKAVSEAIRKFNVVIIIGCAGSGKSHSMQHAALQLQDDCYTVYPIKRCSDLLSYHSKNKKQAFVIDDTFGVDKTDLEVLQDWQKYQSEVNACIASKLTKLMLTIRKEIFNEVGTIFLHRDLHTKEVDINSKDLKLTKVENFDYLCKLSEKRNIEKPNDFLRSCVDTCDLDFFPLLCHTYCTDTEIRTDPLHLFQEPYAMLEKWFREMWNRNPARFYGLVLCVVYGGSLPTRLFDQFRLDLKDEQTQIKKIVNDLDDHVELETIRKELDSLHGVYVYKTNHAYQFVHQTFQDIIAFVIGRQKNGFILKYCKSYFILDRCILSRKVTKIREDVKCELLLPYHKYVQKHKKSSNSYQINVDESIENGIAAKLLQELIEEENFEDFKILAEKVFDSNFLDDERFLNLFSSILNKEIIDNEERKNYLLYELHLNACMIHSKMIDIPFILSYSGFHRHLTFNQENALLLVSIHSENIEVIETLIEQHRVDVNDYKYKYAAVTYYKDCLHYMFLPLTPLCSASGKGSTSMVQLLVKSGADINKFDGRGDTPLTISVRNNNIEIVDVLLNEGADVNCGGDRVWASTPLCTACETGNLNMVRKLLQKGADVNQFNEKGNTPMTISVKENNMNIVDVLLSKIADVNLCDEGEVASTPLCTACETDNVEMVQKLLQKGADINKFNGKGNTPMTISVRENKIDIVDILLSKNADVNLCGESEVASTPLCTACFTGNVEAVRKLLQNGADVNKFNGEGNTPLTISVRENKIDIVDILLSKNADVNLCGESKVASTPLCTTCETGHVDMAQKLLQNGADVNKCNGKGNTPLTLSVIENNMDIVDVLLNHNADVNLCDEGEVASTPLCTACETGNVDMVQILLQKGANANQFNGEGNTPLTISVRKNNIDIDIVEVLLSNNAGVNCGGDWMWASTPLCFACETGNVVLVRKLLQNGANVNKFNVEGNTPLTLSVRENKMNIVDLLLSKNADVNLCGERKSASTPLCTACETGNVDMVQKLLQKGADINNFNGIDVTPLTISVRKNDIDIVDKLLNEGADVNLCNESKAVSTPLCAACKTGNVDMVQKLLQKGADVNQFNRKGNTPLTMSVRENKMDIVDLLLSKYADVNLCGEWESASTPLCTACETGNVDMVQKLLLKGADINNFNGKDVTPLTISVRKNDIDIVDILLNKGADVNCGGYCVWASTPLCTACETGNVNMVRKLLQKGADANQFNGKGNTPMTISVKEGNMNLVDLLLSNDADVNCVGDCVWASTPLSTACKTGNVELVRKLLQNGADVNKINGEGNTALTISVKINNMDIVDVLLSKNADVNCGGDWMWDSTPLCYACETGNVDLVRKLLQNGANINKFNVEGNTPLTISVMEIKMDIVDVLLGENADVNLCGGRESASTPLCTACETANVELVRKLLQNGADVNKFNGEGNTPLTISVMENKMDIVDLLLSKNADVNLCGGRESASTPLCTACETSNVDMVQKLLQYGADVNKFNGEGNTPLTISVMENNVDILDALLSKMHM